MSDMSNVDYSIIIPVYFNEGSLWPTFKKLYTYVVNTSQNLIGQIIFIDDGSKDNSYKILLDIKEKHPDLVTVIKLTRNFGQPSARLAGYHYAKGKCSIHISADLQDPVEIINQMISIHNNENIDIVIGERIKRNDGIMSSLSSKIFYTLIKKLSFENMPVGGFDFHCISKRVKDHIISSKESNPFFQGQVLWTGYSTKFIPYERLERTIGKSKWTFTKKLKLLIDGLLSYSYFPLRMMSLIGFILASSGFLYALWIFIRALMGNKPAVGWAPLMIVILLVSGVQMLMTGIIGEYLWRTLEQVKNRPNFIVEKEHL